MWALTGQCTGFVWRHRLSSMPKPARVFAKTGNTKQALRGLRPPASPVCCGSRLTLGRELRLESRLRSTTRWSSTPSNAMSASHRVRGRKRDRERGGEGGGKGGREGGSGRAVWYCLVGGKIWRCRMDDRASASCRDTSSRVYT